MPNAETFADRLRDMIECSGVTGSDLAELSGLARTHVWVILDRSNPNRTVSARTLARLCDVLGVSMDWLYRGRGSAPDRAAIRARVTRLRRKASSHAA